MENLPDELLRYIRSFVFTHSWRAEIHLDKLEALMAAPYDGHLSHYIFYRPLRRYIREYTKKMAQHLWRPHRDVFFRDRILVGMLNRPYDYWNLLVIQPLQEDTEASMEWSGCVSRENYMDECLRLSGL